MWTPIQIATLMYNGYSEKKGSNKLFRPDSRIYKNVPHYTVDSNIFLLFFPCWLASWFSCTSFEFLIMHTRNVLRQRQFIITACKIFKIFSTIVLKNLLHTVFVCNVIYMLILIANSFNKPLRNSFATKQYAKRNWRWLKPRFC